MENPILLGMTIILLVGFALHRVTAHQCAASCQRWNANPIAAWESEYGAIDWSSPDRVDPRLIECRCR